MKLLPLDDPRWGQLHHAYGVATDVPDLLRALTRGDDRGKSFRSDTNPWSDIWAALCHQGDVYTATYAALPHIVAIAETRPAPERADFLYFAAAVAASKHRALMLEDLRESYDEAVSLAERLATACVVRGIDEDAARALLWALASLRGWRVIGRGLERLGDREIAPTCPECETLLYVTLKRVPFVVDDEDPLRNKKGNQTRLRTRAARPEVLSIAGLAREVGHEGLATKILALDGDVTCPSCEVEFSLLERA